MKKGLIILALMATFPSSARMPKIKQGYEKLKTLISSKLQSSGNSLKKTQRIADRTVNHPLVYAPPAVIALVGMATAVEIIETPILATCFIGLPDLIFKEGLAIGLIKIVGFATPPLLVYSGGCLYALKKAFDAECDESKNS